MNSPTIDLIDETFDVSQSDSCHLSIQTGSDGLSYCILNTVINKYVVLRHYRVSGDDVAVQYRKIFENDELLRLNYKSVKHLFISSRFTLVPDAMYLPEHKNELFYFNHGWREDEYVSVNHISSAGLYDVFSCPDFIRLIINEFHPGTLFYHQAATMMDATLSQSLSTMKHQVVIYFYNGYMDIVVVKSGKLLFYNTFLIKTDNDFIYYLAAVTNLVGIELQSSVIHSAGIIHPSASAIINKYTAGLKENDPFDIFIYSHYLTEQFRVQYVHLFNLYACV